MRTLARLGFFGFALVALLCAGCPSPGPVTPGPDAADATSPGDDAAPPPVPPAIDAAPTPAQDASPPAPPDAGPPDQCAAACARLAALGCPEANGLPGGRDCVTTCRHDTPAVVFDLHPACVVAAQTVAAVQACGVGCAIGKPKPHK